MRRLFGSSSSKHFVLFCAVVLAASTARAASVVDPALHFRTIATDHFVIYFHQGEERTAARLAAIAEDTWTSMSRPFGVQPPPRTHVVLVDQTELANGSATPLPYNTIIVTATWPPGSDFLGKTDDWLRLVFTHEFTHIVHLDRSEGWARGIRDLFGRAPLAFPNVFLPVWQIEGLAVYEESMITGEGRLHSGDFLAVEQEAARAGALEPIDRVSGGLTDWPNGLAAYAYGAGFHAYLVDRYGFEKLAALAEATAGRVPYTASRVFKRIYGKPLGDLWRDYETNLLQNAAQPDTDDRVTRLTTQGFTVSGPRFVPPRCPTCASGIVYPSRTPDDFPSLMTIAPDGSHPRQLTTRYGGLTSGVGDDFIVFDQQEIRRNVGLYSDLFLLDRRSGRVRALTTDARLMDPDLAPDEETIVCVRDGNGQRDLVLVRLAASRRTVDTVTTIAAEPETQFDAPRWSPDGRTIAVARHRPGHESEIVLVDPATRSLTVVAADPSARIVTPAWRPDGRALVAAADFDGDTFNLYEFALDASGRGRQLTHTTGGATWPDVSADGRTIVFVGYTAAGFDVFTMPYDDQPETGGTGENSPLLVGPVRPALPDPPVPRVPPVPPSSAYSPWATLKPTYWTPLLGGTSDQIRFGAGTNGYDVLGYHAYALSATWLVSGPDHQPTDGRLTPDWQLGYAYARWRPTFFATASGTTSFFAGPPASNGAPANSTLRDHQIEAGVLMPFSHVRIVHRALASILRSTDDYAFATSSTSVNRTALRAGWATTSAHVYGYSISPEGGVSVGATAEWVRRSLGALADATSWTADARAYLRAGAPHDVLAIRAAVGSSTGNPLMSRTFLLGGAAGSPDVLDFGSEAFSLLRGFPSDRFAGTHAALVNVDYRWPIARPQRGSGTFPLMLHTVHGALFADAGQVWIGTFRTGDIKTSAGMELSADLIAGYSLPLTATLGVGWGHDGSGRLGDSRAIYLRLGRAF